MGQWEILPFGYGLAAEETAAGLAARIEAAGGEAIAAARHLRTAHLAARPGLDALAAAVRHEVGRAVDLFVTDLDPDVFDPTALRAAVDALLDEALGHLDAATGDDRDAALAAIRATVLRWKAAVPKDRAAIADLDAARQLDIMAKLVASMAIPAVGSSAREWFERAEALRVRGP